MGHTASGCTRADEEFSPCLELMCVVNPNQDVAPDQGRGDAVCFLAF